MSAIADLIEGLSKVLDVTIQPDKKNGGCRLTVEESFDVQIEADTKDDNIIIAAKVFELPPGKFRENVLKDALKANHASPAKPGTLAYVSRINQLICQTYIPSKDLDPEALASHLQMIVDKSKLWRAALMEGRSSPEGAFKKVKGSGKMQTEGIRL